MFTSSINDALYEVTQAMLVPVIVILLLVLVMAIFFLGAFIVEYFTERRRLSAKMPDLLNTIEFCETNELAKNVEKCGLLANQREALLTLLANATLPVDSRVALARRLLETAQEKYKRTLAWTDIISKVGPMLGLMGTLIPLGPGLLALSAGNTAELSEALVVAFGTTVVGLAAAALAMIVSKVRSLWYEQYIAMLDAAETGVLSRIDYENEESQALIATDATARLNASAAPSQAGSKAKASATVGGLEPAHE